MNELFSLFKPVNSEGVVSKRAATDVSVSRLPTYKMVRVKSIHSKEANRENRTVYVLVGIVGIDPRCLPSEMRKWEI